MYATLRAFTYVHARLYLNGGKGTLQTTVGPDGGYLAFFFIADAGRAMPALLMAIAMACF